MPVDSYWIDQQKKPIEARMSDVLEKPHLFQPKDIAELEQLVTAVKLKLESMEGVVSRSRLHTMEVTDFD